MYFTILFLTISPANSLLPIYSSVSNLIILFIFVFLNPFKALSFTTFVDIKDYDLAFRASGLANIEKQEGVKVPVIL